MVIRDSRVISSTEAAWLSWLKINVEARLKVSGPGLVCSSVTCLIRKAEFRVRECEWTPTIIDF